MIVSFNSFSVNLAAREVRRDDRVVDMEPRAYELLVYLLEHRDRAVGKDELQEKVWGTIVSDGALTRGVMKLRKALEDKSESIIKTVPRFGYRFVAALDDEIIAKPGPVATNIQTGGSKSVLAGLGIAALLVFAYVFLAPAEAVDKTVAVLPFTDLSEAQDQQWFADGLAEEILNSLARTPDLSVTSRTSSFSYRDAKLDIPAIAAELGVAHVLEGSVRRDGDQVRVTAQLIRAEDGFHVWSENYDYAYSDLIDVQESVATDIANALQTTMDPKRLAMFVSSGTQSVAAYEQYLKGISGYDSMVATGNVESYTDAIVALEKAVELDPEFALAWREIAEFWATQLSVTRIASKTTDLGPEAVAEAYETAIDAAIKYANDPITALGYQAAKADKQMNMRQALQLNEKLLEERPNDRWGRVRQVDLLNKLNFHEEVVSFIAETSERDNHDPSFAGGALRALAYSGNIEATQSYAETAAVLFENHAVTVYQVHRAFLWSGNVERARDVYRIVEASDLPARSRYLAQLRQLCAEGRVEEAEALFVASGVLYEDRLTTEWLSLITLGNHEAAIDVWRETDVLNDPLLFGGMVGYPSFDAQSFPNLASFLEIHGNEPGPIRQIPYRCKN